MGLPIMCMGRMADEPYYFEKMLINIYSIEELCYCLVEDAALLDQDLLDRELTSWIEKQCGLDSLAHSLEGLINQGASVSAFAGMILEYVGFYDAETILHTEDVIRENANLSIYERGKAKADYFLANQHLLLAIRNYQELLRDIPEYEKQVKSECWHNLGVAYAGLYYFAEAADAFLRAYRLGGEYVHLMAHLGAMRMHLSEQDYVIYLSDHSEYYICSQQVEKILDESESDFEESKDASVLRQIRQLRGQAGYAGGDPGAYYREVDAICLKLKDEYRGLVSGE